MDEAAIQELLAKQEIYECIARYCRGADRHDEELILSTFHPDAVDDHGTPVSPTELAEAVCSNDKNRTYGHHLGNVLIELFGDTALVESYFTAFQAYEEGGERFLRLRGSRFVDRFDKRDGCWKVSHRVVVDDWSRIDTVERTIESPRFGVHPGGFYPDDPVYAMRAAIRSSL